MAAAPGAAAVVVALVPPVAIAAFVGTRCYGGGVHAGHAPAPPASRVPARRGRSPSSRCPSGTSSTAPTSTRRSSACAAAERVPVLRSAVGQYWGTYDAACDATRGRYPFEIGYHVMLGVIGVEPHRRVRDQGASTRTRSAGSPSGCRRPTRPRTSSPPASAAEYGTFMHTDAVVPVPVRGAARRAVGATCRGGGRSVVRKWERRVALTLELGVKAVYGWRDGHGLAGGLRRRGPDDLRADPGASTPTALADGRRPAGAVAGSGADRARCRATRRSRRRARRWSIRGPALQRHRRQRRRLVTALRAPKPARGAAGRAARARAAAADPDARPGATASPCCVPLRALHRRPRARCAGAAIAVEHLYDY